MNTTDNKCANYDTCRGFAEPSRALCSCCIAAQEAAREAVDDARNKKIIGQASVKPRRPSDVWGRL
jgi:hypothetical protein